MCFELRLTYIFYSKIAISITLLHNECLNEDGVLTTILFSFWMFGIATDVLKSKKYSFKKTRVAVKTRKREL